MIVGQQSNYFCKICKKGFGCGRALGGHMRAHGIGDERGQIDDDDPPSNWEDKIDGGSNVPSTNKYGLRTNPNRSKTTRNCANCGKVFFSWKAFFEHGKCSSSVDEESLLSSSPDYENDRRGCSGWSKRKRSLRAKVGGTSGNSLCPSSLEEDLANCLMMLSNATVDPMEAEPEESCASASKEEERIRNPMNNFMSPISRGMAVDHSNKPKGISNNNKGLFECKACKKVFNSHQALGGHRASHKKVKGCFAARLDHLEESMAEDDVINQEELFPPKPNSNFQFDHGSNVAGSSAYSSKRKSKVHECSICHRIFSSGQALGGHKRCHWITSNAAPDTSTLAKFHEFQESIEQQMMNHQMAKFDTSASDPLDLKLDLNLPAPTTEENGGGRRDRLTTNSKASGLDVSTDFFLQSWVGTKEEDNPHLLHSHNQIENDNNIISNDDYNVNNNNSSGSMHNVADEAYSKLKLAKLSELKDINTSGTSSPWLQVGISSTTNVAADP